MQLSKIKHEIKKLLSHISSADVAKIDGSLYVIRKGKNIDSLASEHFEDYELVFETEYHSFNWWEIRSDVTEINSNEWQIGSNVVSFFTIQPI